MGLTILTALANLLPVLPEEEAYLALFHGARRVAADCDGEAPRRERAPLASRPDPATLKRWLRRWTTVRHREAAERTLLTAIAAGASPAVLADAPARGRDRAGVRRRRTLARLHQQGVRVPRPDRLGARRRRLLPTVVGQMVAARGAEELTAWRQPVDLIALCEEAASRTARTVRRRPRRARLVGSRGARPGAARRRPGWRSLMRLKAAIRAGAAPADLGRSLAYAAALRVARFGNANEHADWETAHHVFTYANAVHQMLKRIGTANTDGHVDGGARRPARSDGALPCSLSQCAAGPHSRARAASSSTTCPPMPRTIRAALLDAFDRQRQVDLAARLVARHLTLGHSPQALIATLARAVLREDAGFHAYQMLEAGVRQFGEWGDTDEGRHILIAVARYLAAHSPTERAALQTADIARRLDAGRRAASGSHSVTWTTPVSTAKSSTRCERLRSSSRVGGVTSTRSGRTHRSATSHQPPRCSYLHSPRGRLRYVNRRRRPC